MTREKLTLIVVLVLMAACLATAGCQKSSQQATQPPVAPPATGPAAVPTADTPVVIEAYYPLNEGHKFIADYLKEFEKTNPGTVTVSVYDMQSEEGRRKWAASGLSCAGVFVNGSTHHEITKDGKTEAVDFLQRMDVFWAHEDFETVVKAIMEKAGEKFTPPAKEPSAPKAETSTPAASTPSATQPGTVAGDGATASEKKAQPGK